jgi:hypothetical protein
MQCMYDITKGHKCVVAALSCLITIASLVLGARASIIPRSVVAEVLVRAIVHVGDPAFVDI